MKLRQNKRQNTKCGDFPWNRKWFKRQSQKPPKYFCDNCFKAFRTGKFSRFDDKIYDNVCPNCGAIGLTFEELIEEWKELNKDFTKLFKLYMKTTKKTEKQVEEELLVRE